MTVQDQNRLEARHAREAVTALLDWLDERRDIEPSYRTLLRHDLNRALTEVPSLNRAVDRSPAVAILAPLTPTANRLVSVLAAPRDPRMLGQFHGGHTRLPVIAGLLPPGDTSGLSAIVRLTHDDPGQAANKAADTVGRLMAQSADAARRTTENVIRLDILTLSEVIMILGRAYLANVKIDSIASLSATLAEAVARAGTEAVSSATQAGLAAHQVFDIRSYLEERFHDHPLLDALGSIGYWDSFAALAPRLGSEGRRRLASLLWGGLADFDTVYGEMANAIEALNHATEIICPADAVRSADAVAGWGVAHPHSILAAATLLFPSMDAADLLAVRTKFGQPVAVSRPVLTALVREASIQVEGDPAALLASTDVLHLPAMCPAVVPRSGRASADFSQAGASSDDAPWIARALLQAKTLYLAEAATSASDITGLVMHLDAEQQLSEAFAPILAQWIARTQGRTPAAREANDTTLFVAIDAESERGALADVLKDFVAGSDWLERWRPDSAFDNVFLLGTGQRTTAQLPGTPSVTALPLPPRPTETGTAVATLATTAGLPSTGVMRHVRDSVVALDEALNTTDGGVQYLAQSITAVDYARAKRRQVASRLADLRFGIVDGTRRFLASSNPAEDNDWRHRAALATQSRLRNVASQNQLGLLVDALIPSERNLRWLFERIFAEWAMGEQRSRRDAEPTAAKAAPLPSNEPVALDSEAAARLAGRFGGLATEQWLRRMRVFGSTPSGAANLGFSETTLAHLVDEIVIGATRLDLSSRISTAVARALASAPGTPTLHATRAAMLASELIAAYVSQLGFDTPWSTRHPRRRGTLGAPLFERPDASSPDGIATLQANRVTVQYCSDWCEAFIVLAEENIASARGMRFEEGDFRELEEILALFGSNAREGAL